ALNKDERNFSSLAETEKIRSLHCAISSEEIISCTVDEITGLESLAIKQSRSVEPTASPKIPASFPTGSPPQSEIRRPDGYSIAFIFSWTAIAQARALDARPNEAMKPEPRCPVSLPP